MILVSFFSEDNVLHDLMKSKYAIFSNGTPGIQHQLVGKIVTIQLSSYHQSFQNNYS